MAVPKQKLSRTRTHRRRAENLYKAVETPLSKCPIAGSPDYLIAFVCVAGFIKENKYSSSKKAQKKKNKTAKAVLFFDEDI